MSTPLFLDDDDEEETAWLARWAAVWAAAIMLHADRLRLGRS